MMMPFDEWIRSRPERCSECGYHPLIQGHAEDCKTGQETKR